LIKTIFEMFVDHSVKGVFANVDGNIIL